MHVDGISIANDYDNNYLLVRYLRRIKVVIIFVLWYDEVRTNLNLYNNSSFSNIYHWLLRVLEKHRLIPVSIYVCYYYDMINSLDMKEWIILPLWRRWDTSPLFFLTTYFLLSRTFCALRDPFHFFFHYIIVSTF